MFAVHVWRATEYHELFMLRLERAELRPIRDLDHYSMINRLRGHHHYTDILVICTTVLQPDHHLDLFGWTSVANRDL